MYPPTASVPPLPTPTPQPTRDEAREALEMELLQLRHDYRELHYRLTMLESSMTRQRKQRRDDLAAKPGVPTAEPAKEES